MQAANEGPYRARYGAEHDIRVRLMIYRKRLTLARSLSPDERLRFAGALQDAIRAARNERWS